MMHGQRNIKLWRW